MRPEVKCKIEQKRRYRIRNKVKGTSSRPRMSVRFTERNIYVQFIDDEKGRTLPSASTRHKTQENREKLVANKVAAEKIGKTAAEVAKEVGITEVVFDRSGARYVKGGKVDILANAARAEGLKF